MKLFLCVLGANPNGRLTEQHDVFFGIANHVLELEADMKAFWPEGASSMHIDSYRAIERVENYSIQVVPKNNETKSEQLFFVNLGGYVPQDLEEYHYKLLCVGTSKAEAIHKAKQTVFYRDYNAVSPSHIDDHLGVDIDELFSVEEVLPAKFKDQYSLSITPIQKGDNHKYPEDELCIGYLKFPKKS